ncbi:MAG: DUF1049 domain-containing protein [Alphaproteobacteria bacterium]|nr:DUF1049 domain-containing protein [Alphaproteobacteria bacterium]
MKNPWVRLLTALVVFALIALPLVAFVAQNLSRRSELSLNVGFVQWELVDPVPVPGLMLMSLIVGVLVGLLLGGLREVRVRRQLRDAQSAAAFSGSESGW